MDKLQRASLAFSRLLNVRYEIVVGRKGKTSNIILTFTETEFVHLAGLHKLTDNEFLRAASRKKVFTRAINGDISYDTLEKSSKFDQIHDRIEYLEFLEDMLDSNDIIFKYNPKNNSFSLIRADYLLQSSYDNRDIYIFIDNREDSQSHFCRSFFPKRDLNYTAGQAKCTMLYKKKIDLRTGHEYIQYNKLKENSPLAKHT